MLELNVVLFDRFETLDACGPVEMFGQLRGECDIAYYSLAGGPVKSLQNLVADTRPMAELPGGGVLLVPGSEFIAPHLENGDFIQAIGKAGSRAQYVLSVCTGSVLLARAGLLSGKRATTNKMDFDWVLGLGLDANWVRNARWVVDGNCYTSSGVSAGMDMSLGFIADVLGRQQALKVARCCEYAWNEDKDNDPFG